MKTTRRKKTAAPIELNDDAVDVRVSPRAPSSKDVSGKRPSTPPTRRAQTLATALLEGIISQLAEYVENSHAVEKLIRAQTTIVLRELARDPQLTMLIHAQAEQYVAELTAQPEILEPLVRAQVDRYLEYWLKDSGRRKAVAEKIKRSESPPHKRRPRATKLDLD